MDEYALKVSSQTPLTSLAASVRTSVGGTHVVRIDVTAQSIWYKLGDVTVTATAGTAGESLLNAAGSITFLTGPEQTHVAIIQEAASAKASITVLG